MTDKELSTQSPLVAKAQAMFARFDIDYSDWGSPRVDDNEGEVSYDLKSLEGQPVATVNYFHEDYGLLEIVRDPETKKQLKMSLALEFHQDEITRYHVIFGNNKIGYEIEIDPETEKVEQVWELKYQNPEKKDNRIGLDSLFSDEFENDEEGCELREYEGKPFAKVKEAFELIIAEAKKDQPSSPQNFLKTFFPG